MSPIELREVETCPLCGGRDFKPLLLCHAPDYEVKITGIENILYVICRCGMMFQKRAVADEGAFYKNIYREITESGHEDQFKSEVDRAERIVLEISKRLKPHNVLDVGCSAGFFMEKAEQTLGCKTTGVEPYKKYRQGCVDKGLVVFDNPDKANGKYDLITLLHVLEHTANPREMLEGIKNKADSSTMIVVEVPFFDFRLSHPVLYSEATLRKFLNFCEILVVEMIPGKDLTAICRL